MILFQRKKDKKKMMINHQATPSICVQNVVFRRDSTKCHRKSRKVSPARLPNSAKCHRRERPKFRKVSPGIPQSVTGSSAQFRKASPQGRLQTPQSVTGNSAKCHWLRRPIPQSVTGNSAKCHRPGSRLLNTAWPQAILMCLFSTQCPHPHLSGPSSPSFPR